MAHTPLPPEMHCPYCSTKLDCASGLAPGTTPHEGAASICVQCAQPAIFVNGPFGLAFRKPTPEERASIMEQFGPALVTYLMTRKPRS